MAIYESQIFGITLYIFDSYRSDKTKKQIGAP